VYFDRFDIATAHYCYCVAYHGGKSSPEYRRLSRITRYFRPASYPGDDVPDTTNGRLIMSAIIRRHFVNRKPYAVNL
jgi:hypothetical protein